MRIGKRRLPLEITSSRIRRIRILVPGVLLALLWNALRASEGRSAILQRWDLALTITSLTFDLFGRLAVLIDADVGDPLLLFHADRIRVFFVALRNRDGGEAELIIDFDDLSLAFGVLRHFV